MAKPWSKSAILRFSVLGAAAIHTTWRRYAYCHDTQRSQVGIHTQPCWRDTCTYGGALGVSLARVPSSFASSAYVRSCRVPLVPFRDRFILCEVVPHHDVQQLHCEVIVVGGFVIPNLVSEFFSSRLGAGSARKCGPWPC